MISRRNAIRLAVGGLSSAFALSAPAARADQAFQRLLPLLVDLAGWDGKKPTGMSMDMGGTSMTTANRDYQRGPAQAHAAIIIGPAAEGALAATRSGMHIETSDGHVITTTIGGFPVTKTYNTAQKSGAILVALAKSALFSLAYNGITEDEAMPLSQNFDWKVIQAAAQ